MHHHQHAPELTPARADQRLAGGRLERQQAHECGRRFIGHAAQFARDQRLCVHAEQPDRGKVTALEHRVDERCGQRSVRRGQTLAERERERSGGLLRVRFELLLQGMTRVLHEDRFDAKHQQGKNYRQPDKQLPSERDSCVSASSFCIRSRQARICRGFALRASRTRTTS